MRSHARQPLQSVSEIPARALVVAIEALAARGSNAVLEVLGEARTVESERHYPAHDLRFGGARLRAYYHCHAYPGREAEEHGHFHLFVLPKGVADERGNWAHLVALSMDREGQPHTWLALNGWVAGGPWLGAPALQRELSGVSLPADLSSAEALLGALLTFHAGVLANLLEARDRNLRAIAGRDAAASPNDRRHYVLAHAPITLLAELQQALT